MPTVRLSNGAVARERAPSLFCSAICSRNRPWALTAGGTQLKRLSPAKCPGISPDRYQKWMEWARSVDEKVSAFLQLIA
jgi:hypothetical protein